MQANHFIDIGNVGDDNRVRKREGGGPRRQAKGNKKKKVSSHIYLDR